jgi:hypothetical protein
VRDYAVAGRQLFEGISPADLTMPFMPTYNSGLNTDDLAQQFRKDAIQYFTDLDLIAGQLQSMADKELRQEPFSQADEAFLKDVVIKQLYRQSVGCTVVTRADWNGWYLRLFPWEDDSPARIADISTNANRDPNFPDLLPPAVLHVATGPVATAIFVVNAPEGEMVYTGPVYTYYEVLKEGYPPVRMNDQEWQNQLKVSPPQPPAWTNSFRISVVQPPIYLGVTLDQGAAK